MAGPPHLAQASPAPATDFTREVYCLLGIPLDAVSKSQTISLLVAAVSARRPMCFSTPNLNNLVAAQKDPAFRTALTRSELAVADGMPLVWMAKMLGIPIVERVAGSEVFEALMDGGGGRIGVFFFGGPAGVAKAACERLNAHPGPLHGAGYESPGFGDVEQLSQPDMIARINRSGADFVVIAMGSVKGHAWIAHNRAALVPPVLSHLGAVVNFVAGTLSRAPLLARKSGLEWLWRIKEEPALWRRYWDDSRAMLPLFLGRVLPQALGRLMRGGHLAAAEPAIVAGTGAGAVRIALSGAWSAADLAPLRAAFTAATREPGDVELDLAGLATVDAAFLGLLMLLYGHQSKIGCGLRMTAPDRVRAMFARSCAGYLLDGLSSATTSRSDPTTLSSTEVARSGA